MLTGSGVDEAWTTGVQLAEAVLELLKAGKPLSKENLEATYVAWRRASWVEEEGKVAEKARDGFHRGMIPGLLGMAIAGFTGGKHSVSGEPKLMPSPEEYYREKIPAAELAKIMDDCRARGVSCHNALMDRVGGRPFRTTASCWYRTRTPCSMGGKVQASPGYADHVRFVYPDFCELLCQQNVYRDVLRPGDHGGAPAEFRCSIAKSASTAGACIWNCGVQLSEDPAHSNIAFSAGAGDCTRLRIS